MASEKTLATLRASLDQIDAQCRENFKDLSTDDLRGLNNWWALSGMNCPHSAIFRLFDKMGEVRACGLIVVGVNRLLAQIELGRLESDDLEGGAE